MMRALLVVVLTLVLGACATVPTPTASSGDPLADQVRREAELGQRRNWRLVGKIAVSDGRESGSGRLEWVQEGDDFRITLNAPVSRRSWRLSGAPGQARLEGFEGGPFEGDSAEQLLAEHLGWVVPLGDLAAWARGMRAAGEARIRFSANGLPEVIDQHGWQIEYRQFDTASEPALPSRVFASRGDRRVRLVVEGWSFDPLSN